MATRALRGHSEATARAMEKLSSGRRINRAMDDAAGLGISVKLRARIRSDLMAQRNVQMGISAVQIAEGGLSEIQELVHRLGELAVQSASDSVTDIERGYIQGEVAEIIQEIGALSKTTKFNGKKLLSPHLVDMGFVIDASGSMGQEVDQIIAHAPTFKTNLEAKGFDIKFGVAMVGNGVGVDNVDGVARINDLGDPNFTAALNTVKASGGAHQDPYSAMLNTSGANDVAGTKEPDAFTWRNSATRKLLHVTDVGLEQSLPGVTTDPVAVGKALADVQVEAHIICNTDNAAVNQDFAPIASASGGQLYEIGNSAGDNIANVFNQMEAELTATFGEKTGFDYQVGSDPNDSYDTQFPLNASPGGIGLTGFKLDTKVNAQLALDQIKTALDKMASYWAQLGAVGNRLGAMDRQLSTVIEYQTQANGRIVDADIAQTTSALSKSQILSQMSASVLAQSQALDGQLALKLLGGL